MKKVLTMAAVLSLIALPAWAGGIGVMFSSWDTDEASDDQGGGVKFEFDIGKALDFEIRATWLDSLELASGGDAFKLEVVPVDIGLAYDFRHDAKLQPFIGGGISYNFLHGKVADDSSIRIDDEVGYYAVLGVEGMLTDWFKLFGEALYRDASGEVTSDGLAGRDVEDFGFDLGGVGVNVGLMLSW